MSSIQVQPGFWIDYSKNPVLGATVTVPSRWGGTLISSLTTLVQITGVCTWLIVAFALHQKRTRNQNEDGLFWTIQIILRNPSSAFGSVLDMFKAGSIWNGRVENARFRCFQLLLFPLTVFAVFTIAGVFVGQIAVPLYHTSSVRVKSGNCGFPSWDQSLGLVASLSEAAFVLTATISSRAYARLCYGTGVTAGCSTLPVPSLANQMTNNAPCPFEGLNRCKTGGNGAFQMDTGLLNSHFDFGVNAPSNNRVQIRKVVTCAPVDYDGFVTFVNDSSTGGKFQFIRYNLGSIRDATTGVLTNYTLSYADHTPNDSVGYTVTSTYAIAGAVNDFTPIAPFNRTDADISLHFIASNSVEYLNPVYDPVFSANGTYRGNIPVIFNGRTYLPDQWLNIIGCADQFQFCDPVTGTCSSLSGQVSAANSLETVGFNLQQKATAERLYLAMILSSTYLSVAGLRGGALLAQDQLYNLLSPGLPDNQWESEAGLWVQTSLAKMQQFMVDFPNQSNNLGDGGSIVSAFAWNEDDNAAMQSQCSTQLVRGILGYQSFSFLGLIIIVSLCPVLIVLSWTIEWCVAKLPSRKPEEGTKYYKQVASIACKQPSLLAMTYNGAGYGAWEKGKDGIPILKERGTKLPPAIMNENGLLQYPSPESPAQVLVDDGTLGVSQVQQFLLPKPTASVNQESMEMESLSGTSNVPEQVTHEDQPPRHT